MGLLGVHLYWDGDDRLRQVNDRATGTTVFTARYAEDGLRVQKQDTCGTVLQTHDFSWDPFGLLHENNPTTGVATTYTLGFAQRQVEGR